VFSKSKIFKFLKRDCGTIPVAEIINGKIEIFSKHQRFVIATESSKYLLIFVLYTGCIMKNLWCYNFLIFYPILINDMSNKIVLNGLQFELIQYLFLSSVFD
jgi:hypothetical protein